MSSNIKDTSAVTIKIPWRPEEDYCSKGLGVEGEGIIQHVKFHTITAKDRVERYIVARVKVRSAFAIELDKYDCEKLIDPSDYPDDPRSLNFDQLLEKIRPPPGVLTNVEDEMHPKTEGVFELIAPATTKAKLWAVGEDIHFKTHGDSCFLKKFYYTEKGNFGDDEEGEVLNRLAQMTNQFKGRTNGLDEVEGCESDEWDDDEDD